MATEIKILDHGYVRFIEAWGHGDAGAPLVPSDGDASQVLNWDYECGIIEAARQSTQGSFREWEDQPCPLCRGGLAADPTGLTKCPECEGKGYLPGDERLLRYLHSNRHATPFEFSGMIIEVKAPIAVFREWHRHRTQSYNEMSARYAPLPDVNYMPTPERCLMVSGKNRQAGAIAGADDITHKAALEWLSHLGNLYRHAQNVYDDGLNMGIPKEVARMCLPVGRYSQMRASTCLRNWLSFLTLRMDPQAQWEIRMYANAVGNLIAEYFPHTWALFNAPKM